MISPCIGHPWNFFLIVNNDPNSHNFFLNITGFSCLVVEKKNQCICLNIENTANECSNYLFNYGSDNIKEASHNKTVDIKNNETFFRHAKQSEVRMNIFINLIFIFLSMKYVEQK